jgi:hypothetical protein
MWSQETYEKICEAFRPVTAEHIAMVLTMIYV